jgi:hypothetical protein
MVAIDVSVLTKTSLGQAWMTSEEKERVDLGNASCMVQKMTLYAKLR